MKQKLAYNSGVKEFLLFSKFHIFLQCKISFTQLWYSRNAKDSTKRFSLLSLELVESKYEDLNSEVTAFAFTFLGLYLIVGVCKWI